MANNFFSTPPINNLDHHVHFGLWTNWSRGPTLGQTLTLDRVRGAIFIAVTAVFITIVATRFWRITCLLLHWHYSTNDERDAIHHQRQAVFRNSESSMSGFIQLVNITRAWGKEKSLGRILPFIIYAILCFLGFSTASIFSSTLASFTANEILVDGSLCGTVNMTGLSPLDYAHVYGPWKSAIISNAASYAQQVYSPNSTGTIRASLFVKDRLNIISNTHATCPFLGLCRSNTSNLFLDTGHLNIIDDLGVNLPREQSILYRRTLRCGPLITDNRTEPTDLYGVSNYTGYKYGPSFLNGDAGNYTIIIRDIYSQSIRQSAAVYGFSGYGLLVASALMSNGTFSTGTFRPNPDMYRADSDIYLFFLSGNGVLTTEPTADPWYRFNVLSNETYNGVQGVYSDGYYTSTESASPLGCTMQHQYCKGPDRTDTSCGPLSNYDDAVRGALPLFNISLESSRNWTDGLTETYSTDADASRFLWLLSIFQHYSPGLDSVVGTLGPQSLASQRTLQNGLQGPISDEQWKLDVSNWWNISLSMLQASLIDTANGPTDQNIARLYQNATNRGQKSICQNQKVLGTSYISVSFFALVFTYAIGLFIILIFFALEPMLSRGPKGPGKAYQWQSNELLHLQGLAYEARGRRSWERCLKSVPVPKDKDQVFRPLEWADSKQPGYCLPQARASKRPKTAFHATSTPSPVERIDSAGDDIRVERGFATLPYESDLLLEHLRRPLMSNYPPTGTHGRYAHISYDAAEDDTLRLSSQNSAFEASTRPPAPSPWTREKRG